MRIWPEFRRGKEICPLIRTVRLLECPLIGDYTVVLIWSFSLLLMSYLKLKKSFLNDSASSCFAHPRPEILRHGIITCLHFDTLVAIFQRQHDAKIKTNANYFFKDLLKIFVPMLISKNLTLNLSCKSCRCYILKIALLWIGIYIAAHTLPNQYC